jgi:hypothetical protein
MQFTLSADVAIGITLISFGVYTFAKGASQHLFQDNYTKSTKHIEKLLETANQTSELLIKTVDEKK